MSAWVDISHLVMGFDPLTIVAAQVDKVSGPAHDAEQFAAVFNKMLPVERYIRMSMMIDIAKKTNANPSSKKEVSIIRDRKEIKKISMAMPYPA